MTKIIGTVAALARYPVTSMAGEFLTEAELCWNGIHGDRLYSVYRINDRGRIPWPIARDLSSLVLKSAAYATPEDPRHPDANATDPDGG